MGSDWGEFWRRILRFNWFGHQSSFDLIRRFVVPCTTGHLPAVFASIFPSAPPCRPHVTAVTAIGIDMIQGMNRDFH